MIEIVLWGLVELAVGVRFEWFREGEWVGWDRLSEREGEYKRYEIKRVRVYF